MRHAGSSPIRTAAHRPVLDLYPQRVATIATPTQSQVAPATSLPTTTMSGNIAFGRFDDSFSAASLKAYIAEFISTLVFVFAGVGSAIAYSESLITTK